MNRDLWSYDHYSWKNCN